MQKVLFAESAAMSRVVTVDIVNDNSSILHHLNLILSTPHLHLHTANLILPTSGYVTHSLSHRLPHILNFETPLLTPLSPGHTSASPGPFEAFFIVVLLLLLIGATTHVLRVPPFHSRR